MAPYFYHVSNFPQEFSAPTFCWKCRTDACPFCGQLMHTNPGDDQVCSPLPPQVQGRALSPGVASIMNSAMRQEKFGIPTSVMLKVLYGRERDAGMAGSSSEATSEPVTQPRGAIPLKVKNRLKEEDGKEHNEGRKTRKFKPKFQAILPVLIVLRNTIHHLHSLHHASVKWKITSITLIMPAFLCHRV